MNSKSLEFIYQMDWGFVNVEDREAGETYRIACFAMCCHHCGDFYVEFFPNARQVSLFIGMLHAFACMGVPDEVLTDNMRSVVTRRDTAGHPVWNAEYADFMERVGFRTRLCKPRHPFTKKIEGFFGRLKVEFFHGCDWHGVTIDEFTAMLDAYLRWYRDVRVKSDLGYKSPMAYRMELGLAA